MKLFFCFICLLLLISETCAQDHKNLSVETLNNKTIDFRITKVKPIFNEDEIVIERYRVLLLNVDPTATFYDEEIIRNYFADTNKDWAFNLYLHSINRINAKPFLNLKEEEWRLTNKKEDQAFWINFYEKRRLKIDASEGKNHSDTLVTLTFENRSNDTIFMYTGGLKTFGYTTFLFESEEVHYKGSNIQLGMPFGNVSRDTSSFTHERCNKVINDKRFTLLLPKSKVYFSFNLKLMGYSGFKEKKDYKTHVVFTVEQKFKFFCSKIWVGELVTPQFLIEGTD